MQMRVYVVGFLAAALATWGVGCGATTFPDAISGGSLEDVSAIVSDEDLSPQEKRIALEDLGIDAVRINGLLAGETLGNQFGGTLQSAYEKISGDAFPSLTPDEIQIYADAVGEAGGENLNITDSVAATILELFINEDINNADELAEFLDGSPEIPSNIPSGALDGIFVDFDPDDVLDQIE